MLSAAPSYLVGEFITCASRRIQPFTTPGTATFSVIVVVIVHLHVAAVCAAVGAANTTRELDLLIQLDGFLDIDLFHSDFPFEVSVFLQLLAGN